jgi:hypothetical protein
MAFFPSFPHSLSLLWFSLGIPGDGLTKKKLQRASNCLIEYLGDFAYLAGTLKERRRAMRYLKWLLRQRAGHIRLSDLGRHADVQEVDVPRPGRPPPQSCPLVLLSSCPLVLLSSLGVPSLSLCQAGAMAWAGWAREQSAISHFMGAKGGALRSIEDDTNTFLFFARDDDNRQDVLPRHL